VNTKPTVHFKPYNKHSNPLPHNIQFTNPPHSTLCTHSQRSISTHKINTTSNVRTTFNSLYLNTVHCVNTTNHPFKLTQLTLNSFTEENSISIPHYCTICTCNQRSISTHTINIPSIFRTTFYSQNPPPETMCKHNYQFISNQTINTQSFTARYSNQNHSSQ